MKDIYNRVVKCILEVDKVEGINFIEEIDINPGMCIFQYFDWIEQMELMMECEKQFGIKLHDIDLKEWQTVSDIVTTIEKLI